jgi:hypothetical protein
MSFADFFGGGDDAAGFAVRAGLATFSFPYISVSLRASSAFVVVLIILLKISMIWHYSNSKIL